MDAIAILPTLATVNGALVHTLPEDLYIPPDALEVLLDTFEGPLDLLLYLIKRQNLDIINIPIAQITQQYIAYIQLMGVLNINMAAEYLLMAALLAEIKSRMLLPRQPDIQAEEEDPRATLIRRLQEYECIKNVAEQIDALPRMERELFSTLVDVSTLSVAQPLPELPLTDLLLAFQAVLKRVDQHSHHQITQEPLSVRERMTYILDTLNSVESCIFSQLFRQIEGRAGVVVTFLAILELGKEALIEIIQIEPYSELRVKAI
ncbi:MAG: ScpA family protein [Methylococcales bacterium]|nr:ScpA family protein [Methylococcales bacterium]